MITLPEKLAALVAQLYPPRSIDLTIDRRPQVLDLTGKSTSKFYDDIAKGLFTSGVILGPNSVGWPRYESLIINRARIAGVDDDELRVLVSWLVMQRTATEETA